MTKEKRNILIVVCIIMFIVSCVIGFQVARIKKNTKEEKPRVEKISYQLTYYDDSIPGSKYEIKIEGNKLEIKETHFCSTIDCEPTEENNEFTYSEENIHKLQNFLKSLEKSNMDFNNINESMLNDYQKNVFFGIVTSEEFFELYVEEYQYKMEFSKSMTSGYDVYFKEDGSIVVKEYSSNDDFDIEKINTYTLHFSQEHMDLLNNYAKEQAEKTGENVLVKGPGMYKSEANIIKSIIENNESYLDEESPKILYIISYHGINCLTPSLVLYDDNTYEFYDTFTINNEPVVPKTGTYNYDLTKLIQNIEKYPQDPLGPYSIQGKDTSYTTYSSNVELKELLNSINVSLTGCLKEA